MSSIHDYLLKIIDQKLFYCCLFLDLSTAFDAVDHVILIKKLKKYFGIRGAALDVLESYFTNCFQYTKVNGCSTSTLRIMCGVPQGSTLGSLLFLMLVND